MKISKIKKHTTYTIAILLVLIFISFSLEVRAENIIASGNSQNENEELIPIAADVTCGTIPDYGHNFPAYGSCEYTITYYDDGSSYAVYTYENGYVNIVNTAADGTYTSTWYY